MKLLKWLQQPVQYLVKGVAKIFTPTDDDYPAIGIQPFEDEPYEER